jgi:hypothetical protein
VAGQLTVYAGRGEFLRASFYADNIAQEAERYAHTLQPASVSTWLLVLGIWPATAYIAWRSHRVGLLGDLARLPGDCSRLLGDHVVWSSLVVFGGLLLLLDHTKSPIYAIVLLPSICLALSRLLIGVLESLWRAKPSLALGPSAAAGVLIVFVLLDGQTAYQLTLEQAQQVTPYASVGNQIDQALAPGSRVLGPERWWWAVHTRPYLSLRSVWWQWANNAEPAFIDGAAWTDADDIILNDNVRDDVLHFPDSVQQRFWSFVANCATRVAALDDPSYFGIEIHRVIKPSPDPDLCGGAPMGGLR